MPTAAYTGIIIIANEELAIHGRHSKGFAAPCVFPKIWDSDMNLIYERNMLESAAVRQNGMVHYSAARNIFLPTPTGLSPEVAAIVGTNPLRIIAQELYGIRPTDPVIAHEDALRILSSETNIENLRKGRVVIIVDDKALRTPFTLPVRAGEAAQ
jgi:hypothetical protein